MQISTIGLDIAKNVFQVHGIDAAEKVVVRKTAPTAPSAGVLQSVAAVPDRHGGLRHGPLLGTRTHEAWPPAAVDASEGREGLRQAGGPRSKSGGKERWR
jgi:hypothetical protein